MMNSSFWKLLALAGVLISMLVAPSMIGAQASGKTLRIRLWTVEDAPVPLAHVRVIDARNRQLLVEGTTDTLGQLRFDGMPPIEVRVVISGQRPDGIPLKQVGQDTQGVWVRLPSKDWLMDLRADSDGTVFPDLGIAGVGAVDGRDATAIASGSFDTSIPTVPIATPFPIAPTSQALATPNAVLAARITTPETTVFPGATPRATSSLPGLALLIVLGGLTLIVVATIWRGKL